MVTPPQPPALQTPVYMTMELFELLDTCETLAGELKACGDNIARQALYRQLAQSLDAMDMELENPLPKYLIDRLSVEQLVDTRPQDIIGDSQRLRRYCYTLTQVLSGKEQTPETHETLNDLLLELVDLLIEELLQPQQVNMYV